MLSTEWNEDLSYEDEIDWRSEHERAGDSSAIALIELALEICHTADTDFDTCANEIDRLE